MKSPSNLYDVDQRAQGEYQDWIVTLRVKKDADALSELLKIMASSNATIISWEEIEEN